MSTQSLRKTDDPEWRKWRSRLGGLKGGPIKAERQRRLAAILAEAKLSTEDRQADESSGKRAKDLTTEIREQIFASAFISTGYQAKRAAIIAGYGTGQVARASATRLLRRQSVQAFIRKLREAACMDSLETVQRISDQARGSMDDFVNEEGSIDLARARRNGKIHLLKRYKIKELISADGAKRVEREIELHDAQAALSLMARHHGLLLDVHAVKRLPATSQDLLRELLGELQRTGQLEPFKQALLTAPIDTTATEVQEQPNEG